MHSVNVGAHSPCSDTDDWAHHAPSPSIMSEDRGLEASARALQKGVIEPALQRVAEAEAALTNLLQASNYHTEGNGIHHRQKGARIKRACEPESRSSSGDLLHLSKKAKIVGFKADSPSRLHSSSGSQHQRSYTAIVQRSRSLGSDATASAALVPPFEIQDPATAMIPAQERETAETRLKNLRHRECEHRKKDCLPERLSRSWDPVAEDSPDWGCIPPHIRSDVVQWLYKVRRSYDSKPMSHSDRMNRSPQARRRGRVASLVLRATKTSSIT